MHTTPTPTSTFTWVDLRSSPGSQHLFVQPLGAGLARKATPTSGPTGHVQALALSHSKNRGPSLQHGPAAPARPLPRPRPARSRPLIRQEPPQKTIRQPGPAGLRQALSPTLHLPLPTSRLRHAHPAVLGAGPKRTPRFCSTAAGGSVLRPGRA